MNLKFFAGRTQKRAVKVLFLLWSLIYGKILFHKYWYYLNNRNTDGNQPAFQVNVVAFFTHSLY